MSEEFFEKLREKVRPYFEGVNPCHDFHHTDRVLKMALHIGEKEGADLGVLKVAALLHDVGRREQDNSNGDICHAEKGAEIAREILSDLGVSEESIREVVHCVETHRFRCGNAPDSIEAMVLYDADKLDGIGAIGILRAAYFASGLGAALHNSDIDLETSEELGIEDSTYRFHFFEIVFLSLNL